MKLAWEWEYEVVTQARHFVFWFVDAQFDDYFPYLKQKENLHNFSATTNSLMRSFHKLCSQVSFIKRKNGNGNGDDK